MLKANMLGYALGTLCLLLTNSLTYAYCPENKVFKITKDFKIICEDCPKDCSSCYLDQNDKSICTDCIEGFTLNQENQCVSCIENCSRCNGPELNDCYELKNGYYYDQTIDSIELCFQGCNECTDENTCKVCKEGTYPIIEQGTEDMSVISRCQECNIPNCTYCNKQADQIARNEYLSCSVCKPGYTINNGHCEPCPENCMICESETLECQMCQYGYTMDGSSKKCLSLNNDNCHKANSIGECKLCEAHFFIENTKCQHCSKKEPNCSFCTSNADNFICLDCKNGFYKKDNDTCAACPDKCVRCSEKMCYTCENGYYYNSKSNECAACIIANCKKCSSPDKCSECRRGYFFNKDTKKCEK